MCPSAPPVRHSTTQARLLFDGDAVEDWRRYSPSPPKSMHPPPMEPRNTAQVATATIARVSAVVRPARRASEETGSGGEAASRTASGGGESNSKAENQVVRKSTQSMAI